VKGSAVAHRLRGRLVQRLVQQDRARVLPVHPERNQAVVVAVAVVPTVLQRVERVAARVAHPANAKTCPSGCDRGALPGWNSL